MRKVERLVNLIALLLNTRRPLSVEDIRNTVPGYQQEDYSSFKRMFERDKEELRALGIPIERQFTDVWEVEEGYLIPKDRYYLPDLDLSPEEVAALWIVSQVMVEEPSRQGQAMLKLAMGAGMPSYAPPPGWFRARLQMDAPALPICTEAVAARRTVTFEYKAVGRNKAVKRTVDPYALIHRHDGWYLVGRDHTRDDVRHFRLQRMTSDVRFASRNPGAEFEIPEDFGVEGHLANLPWEGEGTTVEVAFAPRIAWWVEQSLGLKPEGTWKDWSVVKLNVADEDGFLSWVTGFGEDAIVRKPPRVRDALIERLRALAGTTVAS